MKQLSVKSSLYTHAEDPTCLSKTALGTNVMDTTQEVDSLGRTTECGRNYEKLCPGRANSAEMAAIQLCAQDLFASWNVCVISDSEVDTEGFCKRVLHCF